MKNNAQASISANPLEAIRPTIELLPPSITVRVGRRRMTLSWRPRKPLPSLLATLLRRSWRQVLAPVLRVSVTAAAVCGAWQTQALAAAPAPGTLPTGWNVVNGNVTFTQNGATLNINQLSPQAIANFLSFSIGSDAVVNLSQPGAAAAFLAKVTGADISQIYGKLTAPGTVVLFNPNGVMVGPGGVVDVGRFVATTLNINNDDFLAGKLTFARDRASVGTVENHGTITSATGGSVYLIGSAVTNGGIIKSPQGEVILAAGQSVTLADTATPGVTVKVTGSDGSVTNLGAITAEAGRIGIAAGLINNSGTINASSVVREGGRIFLRASQNLTTTATSSISADGAAGGNITLYSDNKAFIDGDVSATGAPGKGGFVETSGLSQLDVVKVPTVGSGGTWLIDPYDLTVIGGDSAYVNTNSSGNYAVTSNGSSSHIKGSVISDQLNNGTSVTLTTGPGGDATAGNITVSAAIVKSAGSAATLTLNANNNIAINADIVSTSGALGLNLNSNYQGQGESGSHAVQVGSNAAISLNGGVFNVNENGGSGNGVLNIASGSVNAGMGGTLNAGGVYVGSSGRLAVESNSSLHADTLDNSGIVNFNGSGSVFSNGVVTNEQGGVMNFSSGNSTFTVSGCGTWVNNGAFTVSGSGQVLSMSNLGGLENNGNLTVSGGAALQGAGGASLTNSGIVTLNSGSLTFANILNDETGSITGSGYINTDYGFTNNGIVTPGGTGTLGSLNFSGGGYTQNESGEMRIDIAAGDTDHITFNTAYVHLGGTLRTGLLGGYQPKESANVSFSPITLTGGASQLDDSYFHTVTGDVFTIDGGKQMIKAVYDGNNGITLAMKGSATFIANGSGADWVDRNAWGDGNGGTLSTYLPTQIDKVVINNVSVRHGSGTDTVDSMVIGGTGRLDMEGGDLTVLTGSSFTDSASLSLYGGNISLGNTSIAQGTRLFVNAGNMTMANAAVNGEIDLYHGNLTLNGTTTGSGYLTMASGGGEEGGEGNFNNFVAIDPSAKTLNMANAVSNLSVQVMDGDFNYSGSVRLGALSVYSGKVNGATGSKLNVAENFYQGGGAINVDSAAFSTGYDFLTVGNITANNLVLEARNGKIVQNAYTSLHVKKQLIASAVTGIDLGRPGEQYSEVPAPDNHIAAFAASNSGMGDITLINSLNADDTDAVTINGVSAAGGKINIENYGAMRTAAIGGNADFLGSMPMSLGDSEASAASKLAALGIDTSGRVTSATGSVGMATHSPLTIGIGGINAAGGITLAAGASSGSNDTLVINGLLSSLGGNITLTAGDNMTINANISTAPPGFAIFSVASGALIGYARGVSITDANGTVIPVPLAPSPSPPADISQTQQVVTLQQNQQTQSLQTAISTAQNSLAATQSVGNPVQQGTTANNSQTVGGTSGNFGDEGESKQAGKKPLPMCT